MSEPVSAYVDYDAPFSAENVALLLGEVCAGVTEDWKAHLAKDDERMPDLHDLTNGDAVVDVLAEIDSGRYRWSSGNSSSKHRYFAFCPSSTFRAYISIWRYGDHTIGVGLVAPESVIFELHGDREREEMERTWADRKKMMGQPIGPVFEGPCPEDVDEDEYDAWWAKYHALTETPSVWPQSRQCLLNIVEHLKKALPVREVHLDPRLLEQPSKS